MNKRISVNYNLICIVDQLIRYKNNNFHFEDIQCNYRTKELAWH